MFEHDRLRQGLDALAIQASGQLPTTRKALAHRRFDARSYSSLIGLPVTQVAQVQVLDPASADFGKFVPIIGFDDL